MYYRYMCVFSFICVHTCIHCHPVHNDEWRHLQFFMGTMQLSLYTRKTLDSPLGLTVTEPIVRSRMISLINVYSSIIMFLVPDKLSRKLSCQNRVRKTSVRLAMMVYFTFYHGHISLTITQLSVSIRQCWCWYMRRIQCLDEHLMF